jgi:iron complex outermembrane receptor protein
MGIRMDQRCLMTVCLVGLAVPGAWCATTEAELAPTIVLGQREVRDLSRVFGSALREAPAGSSPLKLLNQLPGVAWTGSDNLGNYEWGNDLSVRGFGLNQIGFTLDAIPLGSTHYWYSTGIDPNRAIIAEDLSSITLTPGSGTLAVPSNNALGATVSLASDLPDTAFGFRFKQSVGSYGNDRSYVRLDSGELASGLTAYVSVASSMADKWKGMGSSGQQVFGMFARDAGESVTGADARWGSYHDQLNLKLIQPLGEHRLTLFYAYSDKRENDYADLTLPVLQKRGYQFDNYTNWNEALRDTDEDAYFGSSMSYRRDHLAALTGEFRLDTHTRLKLTPYAQREWGYGDWHLPSSSQGTMSNMQYRRSQVESERNGINSSLSIEAGLHEFDFGLWLEQSRYIRQRYLYDLANWRVAPSVDFERPVASLMNRSYVTDTVQFFAQDRVLLNEQWLLSVGAKVSQMRTGFIDFWGLFPANSQSRRSSFLPQIGLNYQYTPGNEFFGYYAENVGVIPITVFTTSHFNRNIEPELTQTLEAGWRHGEEGLTTSLSVYAIRYRNRLLQINNCTLLGTCPSLIANVGAVEKRGVEASVQKRFQGHWTVSGALAYNNSRYAGDYLSQGRVVSTAGKVPVNSPTWLASWELRHEQGGAFVALKGKYTGQRFASYNNDLAVPGYTLWSMSTGYTCQRCLGMQRIQTQLSMENVGNQEYIATIGQSGFSASDPSGANTYVQVGAPRMVWLSVSAAFN